MARIGRGWIRGFRSDESPGLPFPGRTSYILTLLSPLSLSHPRLEYSSLCFFFFFLSSSYPVSSLSFQPWLKPPSVWDSVGLWGRERSSLGNGPQGRPWQGQGRQRRQEEEGRERYIHACLLMPNGDILCIIAALVVFVLASTELLFVYRHQYMDACMVVCSLLCMCKGLKMGAISSGNLFLSFSVCALPHFPSAPRLCLLCSGLKDTTAMSSPFNLFSNYEAVSRRLARTSSLFFSWCNVRRVPAGRGWVMRFVSLQRIAAAVQAPTSRFQAFLLSSSSSLLPFLLLFPTALLFVYLSTVMLYIYETEFLVLAAVPNAIDVTVTTPYESQVTLKVCC